MPGNLPQREFAFTLHNDQFLRYESYTTYEDFRAFLLQRNPMRIELGATYNARV